MCRCSHRLGHAVQLPRSACAGAATGWGRLCRHSCRFRAARRLEQYECAGAATGWGRAAPPPPGARSCWLGSSSKAGLCAGAATGWVVPRTATGWGHAAPRAPWHSCSRRSVPVQPPAGVEPARKCLSVPVQPPAGVEPLAGRSHRLGSCRVAKEAEFRRVTKGAGAATGRGRAAQTYLRALWCRCSHRLGVTAKLEESYVPVQPPAGPMAQPPAGGRAALRLVVCRRSRRRAAAGVAGVDAQCRCTERPQDDHECRCSHRLGHRYQRACRCSHRLGSCQRHGSVLRDACRCSHRLGSLWVGAGAATGWGSRAEGVSIRAAKCRCSHRPGSSKTSNSAGAATGWVVPRRLGVAGLG